MQSELLTASRLISLRIGEVECHVPENSSLLRCFEYLRLYPISMGGFCWNADCRTCEVTVHTECSGEQTVLSCQTQVCEGMAVVGMTDKLKFCLRTLTK
jgi:predicted molibdopterin-dependent oxidoreductase YjgC